MTLGLSWKKEISKVHVLSMGKIHYSYTIAIREEDHGELNS